MFQITWEQDRRVAVLADAANRLEICPALGFNAYRWQTAGQELLYRSPQFFTENRATRSGFPILFPFPNRIRDGRYFWPPSPPGRGAGGEGGVYQLPINDPANKNAIHGFVSSRAWRVVDEGADEQSAWITGEFHGSQDAPETLALWPADYRLRVTYRLLDRVLRVEADADNPDATLLPFGLGYHPYFSLAPFDGPAASVTLSAGKVWELIDNLPTGKLLAVDEGRDLREGQFIANLKLDDVYTDLSSVAYDPADELGLVGVIQHSSAQRMLTLWTGGDFREIVAFIPPHREAVCLEPYTCMTDAINLAARGINGGLRVLQPGEHWHGVIEMHLTS